MGLLTDAIGGSFGQGLGKANAGIVSAIYGQNPQTGMNAYDEQQEKEQMLGFLAKMRKEGKFGKAEFYDELINTGLIKTPDSLFKVLKAKDEVQKLPEKKLDDFIDRATKISKLPSSAREQTAPAVGMTGEELTPASEKKEALKALPSPFGNHIKSLLNISPDQMINPEAEKQYQSIFKNMIDTKTTIDWTNPQSIMQSFAGDTPQEKAENYLKAIEVTDKLFKKLMGIEDMGNAAAPTIQPTPEPVVNQQPSNPSQGNYTPESLAEIDRLQKLIDEGALTPEEADAIYQKKFGGKVK